MDSSCIQIVSFIWNIADDVFMKGQYRDKILPMIVLRGLDALLQSSNEKIEESGIENINDDVLKGLIELCYFTVK